MLVLLRLVNGKKQAYNTNVTRLRARAKYTRYLLKRGKRLMLILTASLVGLSLWFLVRCVLTGIYTVDQNERAVKTVFGRAQRVASGKTTLDDPVAEALRSDERDRYAYPQVRVIPPGGPYFKMPW